MKEILQMILDKKVEIPEEDLKNFNERSTEPSFKNCSALLVLVKKRLQFVLRHLIKLCLSKPAINKDCSQLVKSYKESYTLTFELENCLDFDAFIKKINIILTKISDLVSDIDSK